MPLRITIAEEKGDTRHNVGFPQTSVELLKEERWREDFGKVSTVRPKPPATLRILLVKVKLWASHGQHTNSARVVLRLPTYIYTYIQTYNK